jgi:hypothetical protein
VKARLSQKKEEEVRQSVKNAIKELTLPSILCSIDEDIEHQF